MEFYHNSWSSESLCVKLDISFDIVDSWVMPRQNEKLLNETSPSPLEFLETRVKYLVSSSVVDIKEIGRTIINRPAPYVEVNVTMTKMFLIWCEKSRKRQQFDQTPLHDELCSSVSLLSQRSFALKVFNKEFLFALQPQAEERFLNRNFPVWVRWFSLALSAL